MKRYAAIIIVPVVILCSCNMVSKPQAVAMNNSMAQINDSLFLMGREFGNLIKDAVQSRDFGSLAQPRIRFEAFIDSSRQHLVKMKDIYGSGPLRTSEIALLDVEKHMVADDFSRFEHLTSFSGLQDITVLFDKIKSDSKEESEKMAYFKAEQRKYAKRNGFKLEEPRMER